MNNFRGIAPLIQKIISKKANIMKKINKNKIFH